MLRMARRTWALVRQWQPDVVHVHSTYAGFLLRPLLMLMPHRPRVVYCAHGWAFDRRAPRWLNGVVAGIERLAATRGNAHGYWTVSPLLARLAASGGKLREATAPGV